LARMDILASAVSRRSLEKLTINGDVGSFALAGRAVLEKDANSTLASL
jgi:hypothetical protein